MFTNKKQKQINNKIIILSKNDELYSCGVQNMIQKRLLEIDTVKNTTITNRKYYEFCFEKHKTCLEKSSKFTINTKSTNVNNTWQN